MRVICKYSFGFLFLFLFLAETIGITAKEHICSSSNRIRITLFSSQRDEENGCCLSQQPKNDLLPLPRQTANIENPGCCKTILHYLRADFLLIHVFPHSAGSPHVPVAEINPFVSGIPEDIFANSHLPFYNDTGPPLSGRDRIISFGRIKIPFPPAFIS